jgi:hypothetical protein
MNTCISYYVLSALFTGDFLLHIRVDTIAGMWKVLTEPLINHAIKFYGTPKKHQELNGHENYPLVGCWGPNLLTEMAKTGLPNAK